MPLGSLLIRQVALIDSRSMLALSIRQPYAELILRGVKRIEYRSRATRIIRFGITSQSG